MQTLLGEKVRSTDHLSICANVYNDTGKTLYAGNNQTEDLSTVGGAAAAVYFSKLQTVFSQL